MSSRKLEWWPDNCWVFFLFPPENNSTDRGKSSKFALKIVYGVQVQYLWSTCTENLPVQIGMHSKFYTKNTRICRCCTRNCRWIGKNCTEKRADHRILSKFSAKNCHRSTMRAYVRRNVRQNERTVQITFAQMKFLV
jgi:hypothetical protein